MSGRWNGLLLAPAHPAMAELAAQTDPARHHAIDPEASVELQPHLDDRLLGGEIGVLRIADDEIADLLGPEADLVEVILGGDSAAFELVLEEVGRDRAPFDPDHRDGEDQEDEQADRKPLGYASPKWTANDDARLRARLWRAQPLVSHPLVHWAF